MGGREGVPGNAVPAAAPVQAPVPDDALDLLPGLAAQHVGVGLTTLGVRDGVVRMLWVNDVFSRITGYAAHEVVGLEPRLFYSDQWSEVGVASLATEVRAGRTASITLPFRRPDGASVWLALSLTAVPADAVASVVPTEDEADGGPAEMWIASFSDVTGTVERNVHLRDAMRAERRARLHLALLSRVSDLLSEPDPDEALTQVTALLAPALVQWAGAFLVEGGLRLVGHDPGRADGLRRDAARRRTLRRVSPGDPTGAYEIDRVLGGLQSEAILDLTLVHPDESAAALVQGQVLAAEPGLALLSPRVRVVGVLGSRSVLALLVHAVSESGGVPQLADELEQVLGVVVRRVGLALDNARLYAREHELAETMQRSLLPRQVEIDGLDLWTYYAPSVAHAQVGGDWYDVLEVAPGVAGVVVGDVVGHDVEAAALMGQLRSVVRAYAFEGGSPASVLDRTDQLMRGMRAPRAASAVYGTLMPRVGSPGTWVFEYARAGHLPAVLVRDGQATQLAQGAGALIGFGRRARTGGRAVLVPGDTLVLYTDGLIERRARPLRAGLEALLAAAARTQAQDAAGIGEELLAALADSPEDDVAVVVVRVPQEGAPTTGTAAGPRSRRWSMPSDPAAIARSRHAVLRTCEAWGIAEVADAELVVSELVANAVLHGWGTVELRLFDTGDGLRIEVEDANPAPPVKLDGHAHGVGGYGVQIVDRLADWGWRAANDGKIVWARLRAR
ncbi:SpoIIE family protein phosphatase [Sanguibacter sp. HDW7]|uniref:ATP-binding SpoIIE family protein phosphatase n=1 Tax=Sanguibacter sp. HDW7 TaxID=2714931 RepID=UPI001F0D8D3E|nr:SpoIIE family protein phosphatase [Sanguibacter sp. HDW7]